MIKYKEFLNLKSSKEFPVVVKNWAIMRLNRRLLSIRNSRNKYVYWFDITFYYYQSIYNVRSKDYGSFKKMKISADVYFKIRDKQCRSKGMRIHMKELRGAL